MKDKVRQVLVLREGGDVKRCHVHRYHGSYTVGSHSFGAACLLMVLNPDCSKELLQAVLVHDIQERWVGDMPSPAKWYNESLGKEYKAAEERVIRQWKVPLPTLTTAEQTWLDAVDNVELMLWIYDQKSLGNANLDWILHQLRIYFDANAQRWPQAINEFLLVYKWERLPEYEPEKKNDA